MAALSTLQRMSETKLRERAEKLLGDGEQVRQSTRSELISLVYSLENEPQDVTSTESQQVKNARRQVASANIQHIEVEMPMSALVEEGEDNTEIHRIGFANDVTVTIQRLGINYIAYRLSMPKQIVVDFLNGDAQIEEFVDAANEAWETADEKRRGSLIAAIVDGELVGLMRNYIPVDHDQVLDAIETSGLGNDMVHSSVDRICMNVVLSVSAAQKTIVGLRLLNGHSGHVSFRYSATFMVEGYTYNMPLSERVRHLAGVDQALDNLQTLIGEVGELKIDETLKSIDIHEVRRILFNAIPEPNKRQATLIDTPANWNDCKTAMDFIISIAKFTKVNGYAKAATTIINAIVEHALEPGA